MWLQAQLLFCFASLHFAAPEETAPEQKSMENEWAAHHEQEHNGPSTYEFGYELEDTKTFNIQHRKEERHPNGTVTGSYGLLEPDGSVRMVHYVADEHGYRALVEKGDNSSNSEGSLSDGDSIANKLEPMKHLSNDDLIHVPNSPVLVTAINSLKQFAASSIHEIRERPSSSPPHGRNASDFYIFIPDKILIRREVEGKKGEFVTEEVNTAFDSTGVRSLVKRSADPGPNPSYALGKIQLPADSPLNRKSVVFLLDQNDPQFGLHERRKRQLTGQNGQFLTVQQEGNGAPPQTVTYNNQQNAPPQDPGFYEKIAPKIQDFTQNLAQQWANYATNQQPLQPVLNSLPQSSGQPYVMGVPPNYDKQTYRYPLNDGPPGEYAAPMNQQYNAAPPINGQYVGPPTNQYNGPPPEQSQSFGPMNQPYVANPQPYPASPMNIEINGAPAGPDPQYNQYGPPPEDDYQGGQPPANVILPQGYGQYNGPPIQTSQQLTDPTPFQIPPSVPTSYQAPINIPQQSPYPDTPSSPIIPPAAYPAAQPDAPPMQFNNLNGPIGEHLNGLNAPAVNQLQVQHFNTPYGVDPNPYVKVVPQEIDPNQYNLFNRPTGKQTGPSSPRPLPTDADYYTNYYGNPYDPLDMNALKKNRIYVEPDVNRHNGYSNGQRPYDIVQTGTNRYLPASSNSLQYNASPPPPSQDNGEQPSSPAPSMVSSPSPSPPPPSPSPSSPTPTPSPADPKTRIIYYDDKIKD